MYFYVSLDYFGLMLLVTFCWVGLCFFHYRAKRLAGKNVSETTYFVSSGTEKTLLHTTLLMLPPLTLTYIYEELLLANCGCLSTRVPGSSAAA